MEGRELSQPGTDPSDSRRAAWQREEEEEEEEKE